MHDKGVCVCECTAIREEGMYVNARQRSVSV